MTDRWTELLSDYLDNGLDAGSRTELESHLRGCSDCTEALDDLRLVVARARSLPARDGAPNVDLWPAIEARIHGAALPPAPVRIPVRRGPAWTHRRVSFSLPQLAAACVTLAIVSGGAVWYARQSALDDRTIRSGALIAGTADVARSRGGFDNALPAGTNAAPSKAGHEELRRILAEGRDKLDPATVRTLEESLTIIEIAIAQARRALEADPANPYVRTHLDKTMQRKADLLRRATMLASAP